MSKLICEAAVKRYARQCRKDRAPEAPPVRVSGEYIAVLENELARTIREHVRLNGSKQTLKADVFLTFKG